MAKKFVKLTTGGSSPSANRDYYLICYNAIASGRGTLICSYKLYSENQGDGLTFHSMGENGQQWITLKKGEKISFRAHGNGFEYIRSDSLGINVTQENVDTEWIELTDDLLDLKFYSWVSDSSGGSND